MKEATKETFAFFSQDQTEIQVHKWGIKDEKAKGIVQISHGMAETATRYERFAQELNKEGYIVYGNDHRGHGKSAKNIEALGYLGDNRGFELLIQDMATLTDRIKKEYPNMPIYLFSHSMGSFASQKYIMDYKEKIDGLILSGSNGRQGFLLKAGKLVANIEKMVKGRKFKSKMLDSLVFGSYNKPFASDGTGFEWLSRDTEEVEKYVKDPYCGTLFPTSFYCDFIAVLEDIEDKRNFGKIPKNIPILLISGEEDPVGGFGKGVEELYNRYLKCGVEQVELKLYEGARHELLNEINRDEVTLDILKWLEKRKKD